MAPCITSCIPPLYMYHLFTCTVETPLAKTGSEAQNSFRGSLLMLFFVEVMRRMHGVVLKQREKQQGPDGLYLHTLQLPMDRYIYFGDVTHRKPTFSFASSFPLFTSLSPILLRYLRFYLVTSRKFGVSQRDSSIFFTPNGTGHNDPLAIVRYVDLYKYSAFLAKITRGAYTCLREQHIASVGAPG